jgi:hypothetical protein
MARIRAVGPRVWWLLLVVVAGVWLMNATPPVAPRIVVSDTVVAPGQQGAPQRSDLPASRLLD